MFRNVRFAREGVEQQARSRVKIDIVIPGARALVRAGLAHKLNLELLWQVLIYRLSAWKKY
jgi:hypothetical protein